MNTNDSRDINCCPYCGSLRLQRTHSGLYCHFKPHYGPFDFLRCIDCGSGTTSPVPSREQLHELYASYEDGMPRCLRSIMEDRSISPWHELPVKRIHALAGLTHESQFLWHDAGAGEMARLMVAAFPMAKGLCTDLHERPATLGQHADSIRWVQADLNEDDFANRCAQRADVVYATGVWEHVRKPDMFVRNLLRLLKPQGLLYLICPNIDSWAFKLLGAHWPYFSPGEHIHMPTPAGARACIERQLEATGCRSSVTVRSSPISIPYKLNYFANFVAMRLGFSRPISVFPRKMALSLPTGALETWARENSVRQTED